MRTSKIASSFSLLVLAVLAFGQDYQGLSDKLGRATPNDAARIVQDLDQSGAPAELQTAIDSYLSEEPRDRADELKRLRSVLDLLAISAAGRAPKQAKADIQKIKSSPLYRDTGINESSNWLARSLENIQKMLERIRAPQVDAPDVRPPAVNMSWLMYLAWGIILLVVLAFVFFAVRHFKWQQTLKRKVRTLLEEDEPDRSADEWLTLADSLIAEGRLREAIRCLYLACLLKFDEFGVARFDRGQTNWEHLHRIRNSPRLPPYVDFEPPTQAFDRVWYGFHVRGMADVDDFKAWYRGITEALRGKAA